MMPEQVAKVIQSLGSEGITAFYVWLAVEFLDDLIFLGLLTWGCCSAWPSVKMLFEKIKDEM